MELKEALYTRRAVRSFRRTPVDPGLIAQVIDAATYAPTAMNAQPWVFAVMDDADMIADLSGRTKAHLLANLDGMPALETYRGTFADPKFDIFYGAPAVVIICAKPNLSPTAETDCAMAAQNLMLAARGLGLGTCWIGFAAIYLVGAAAKQELGIPADYTVVAPIALGFPEGAFSKAEKNPPEILRIRR